MLAPSLQAVPLESKASNHSVAGEPLASFSDWMYCKDPVTLSLPAESLKLKGPVFEDAMSEFISDINPDVELS